MKIKSRYTEETDLRGVKDRVRLVRLLVYCAVSVLLTSQVSLPFAWITEPAIDSCFGLLYPLPGTTVSSTTLSLDSPVSPPPPESDLTTFLRLSITRNDPERFGDCKSSRICGKFILSAESGFITRTRAPISLTLTSPLTSLICKK